MVILEVWAQFKVDIDRLSDLMGMAQYLTLLDLFYYL